MARIYRGSQEKQTPSQNTECFSSSCCYSQVKCLLLSCQPKESTSLHNQNASDLEIWEEHRILSRQKIFLPQVFPLLLLCLYLLPTPFWLAMTGLAVKATALHSPCQEKRSVCVCVCTPPHQPVIQNEKKKKSKQCSSSSSQRCRLKALPVTVNLETWWQPRVCTVQALLRSGNVCLWDSAKVLHMQVCVCKCVQLSVNNSHCCQPPMSVNMCLSRWAGLSVRQFIICLHKAKYSQQMAIGQRGCVCVYVCFVGLAPRLVNFIWLRKLFLYTHILFTKQTAHTSEGPRSVL